MRIFPTIIAILSLPAAAASFVGNGQLLGNGSLAASLPATAAVAVQSWQNFSNVTVGSLVTDATLNGGRVGTGGWIQHSDGSNQPYTSLFAVTNFNLPLPWTITVEGQTFNSTGTRWARSWLTNTAETGEAAGFQAPGGSGGVLTNMTLYWVMELKSTNDSITGVNLDVFATSGNPECICELQTGAGNYRFIAHSPNGANGAAIDVDPGFYALKLQRKPTTGHCYLDVWEWNGSAWVYLGQSDGTMPQSGTSWWARLQPNYLLLEAQPVAGTHTWAAVAVSYE